MSGIVQKALRRSLRQVRYVSPVRPGAATDLVARVYQQLEHDFGMLAPPQALHSPAPKVLAGSWMILREPLLAPGLVARATKEAVAAAVSVGNACPYCVAVHGATMHGLISGIAAKDVADGDFAAITDPAVRRIALWANASGTVDTATRTPAPFPVEQAPELIGTAVSFQYINRMVNVFLDDSPLPPSVPSIMRGTVMRVLGTFMRSAARTELAAGTAPDLLPSAPLPDDMAWAAGNPGVAAAFARAWAVIDAAGADTVPAPVRELVRTRLAAWDGAPMGISRAWVEQDVAGLSEQDRPAGRLALLTAMASYQVDPAVVAAFQERWPGDAALIEITSWASLTAARRVGRWMWAAIRPDHLAPAQDAPAP